MNNAQGRAVESLRAATNFVAQHADKLGGLAGAGTATQLGAEVAALDTFGSTQDSSGRAAQGLTSKKGSLTTILRRDHMLPISRIAELDLSTAPDIGNMRMPVGTVSAQVLRTAALGMADHAAAYADTFVAAGLAPDFITKLRAAADELAASIDVRNQHRGLRGSATKEIAQLIGRARKTLKALDAQVSVALKQEADLLGQWKIVIRPLAKGVKPVAKPVTPVPPASDATAKAA